MPPLNPTTELKRGSRGADVVALQERLNALGMNAGTADGIFGLRTEESVLRFQERFLGSDRRFLKERRVVGPNTVWALNNADTDAQRNNFIGRIPKGTPPGRARLLEIALAEHAAGIKETPLGSNWSVQPNGGIAKYEALDTAKGPWPWCQRAVSWVCYTASKEPGAPAVLVDRVRLMGGGGSVMVSRARARDLTSQHHTDPPFWYPVGYGYVPRPGDVFSMERHTGFVLGVSEDGNDIGTIEGNASNRWKIGIRSIDSMRGFIDYFADPDTFEFERGLPAEKSLAGDTTR